MTRFQPIATLMIALAAGSSMAAEPPKGVEYKASQLVMLQPERVIAQRVEVSPLVETIKAVQVVASGYRVEGKAPDWVRACSVFVAIRHPSQLRTWSVCDGADAPGLDAAIAAGVRETSIAPVKEGSVIVQLVAPDTSAATATGPGAVPGAWRAVAAGHEGPVEMEQLLNLVWPM